MLPRSKLVYIIAGEVTGLTGLYDLSQNLHILQLLFTPLLCFVLHG